jgi:hypothetical protein
MDTIVVVVVVILNDWIEHLFFFLIGIHKRRDTYGSWQQQ